MMMQCGEVYSDDDEGLVEAVNSDDDNDDDNDDDDDESGNTKNYESECD